MHVPLLAGVTHTGVHVPIAAEWWRKVLDRSQKLNSIADQETCMDCIAIRFTVLIQYKVVRNVPNFTCANWIPGPGNLAIPFRIQ